MKLRICIVFALGCALLALGCASAPLPVDPSGVDISVSRMTQPEMLAKYGQTKYEPNPYRTPGGLIMGYPNELVVLKVVVNAARSTEISIVSITAKDAEGQDVARYYDLPEFIDYLQSWTYRSVINPQNIRIAKDTYLPSMDFICRKGQNIYYAVLIGKNPLPRPFKVEFTAYVDQGPIRQLGFEVTGR